jgi:tRNA A-37 threonylcarbamoyl transferase component Bud32
MNNLDADSLIRAGREVKEPFQLSLTRSDGTTVDLTVRKILRLLPAKRIVALAESEGKQLLIKLFIGRHAKKYEQREAKGIRAIDGANVLTPKLEWEGSLRSKGGYALAFEYIPQASNLRDALEATINDEQRLSLIRKVIPALVGMHAGGVVQNDIHPENFLLAEGEVYTIDGGDVKDRHQPLDEKSSLNNLGLFLAQFGARDDHLIPALFEDYRRLRDWLERPQEIVDKLCDLVRRKREDRKKSYIQKAFRECTRFSCHKDLGRYTVCERRYDSPAMRAILEDLDGAISQGQLLKDGNTATVALVDGPEFALVIKRYNIKDNLHLLQRTFRKSRAWVSWANALRLEFLGIKSVKPVALVEQRFGPLRGKAYLVTAYVDGPDATQLGNRQDPTLEISSIAQMLTSLSQAGVTHGDLKASNFLLGRDGPVIIDLDSMREHRDPMRTKKAFDKDIKRFMKNWESNPVMEERFARLLG